MVHSLQRQSTLQEPRSSIAQHQPADNILYPRRTEAVADEIAPTSVDSPKPPIAIVDVASNRRVAATATNYSATKSKFESRILAALTEEEKSSEENDRGDAKLRLEVPAQSKVFINNRLTKTQGSNRVFISRNLEIDKEYCFQVKVVYNQDGEESSRESTVWLKPGMDRSLVFNFEPLMTQIVFKVPSGTRILVNGVKANSGKCGGYSVFNTDQIEAGKSADFKIEVVNEDDSRSEKIVTLAGGEFRFFEIGSWEDEANLTLLARN